MAKRHTEMWQEHMEWPPISRRERIQHELLFYSQGPLDGYLTGEHCRNLFLHSGLPLPVLSRIWNLADVTNDNVVDVGEFSVLMHLAQSCIAGVKLPMTLPESLYPTRTRPVHPPTLIEEDRRLYLEPFTSLTTKDNDYIEGTTAKKMLLCSGLSRDLLSVIWDLVDLDKDGRLSADEWILMCHLVSSVMQGYSLEGSVDVFSCVPHKLSPFSLQAQKIRVTTYQADKAKLMALKERRKDECFREIRRHAVQQDKIALLQTLHEILKASCPEKINENFLNNLKKEKVKLEKLEKIVTRLRREHERVRQETVKAILQEQKLEEDQRLLKRETEQIAMRLSTPHTKATKDPDPFHQLHEERKELKKKDPKAAVLQNLPDIHIPFVFSPFDKDYLTQTKSRSRDDDDVFADCDNCANDDITPEKAQQLWSNIIGSADTSMAKSTHSMGKRMNRKLGQISGLQPIKEEDPIFKTVPVSRRDEEFWFTLYLTPDGTTGGQLVDLHRKLQSLRAEVEKLNAEGGQLVFKNPEDYTTITQTKVPGSSRRCRNKWSENAARRHTSPTANPNVEEESASKKAAREYRLKRRSLNLEQQKALGESVAVSCIKGGSAENIRASPRSSPRASPRTSRILSWRTGRLPSVGDSSTIQRTTPQRLDFTQKLDIPHSSRGELEHNDQSGLAKTGNEPSVIKTPSDSRNEQSVVIEDASRQAREDGDVFSDSVSTGTVSDISITCETTDTRSESLSPVDSGSYFEPERLVDVFDDSLVFIEEVEGEGDLTEDSYNDDSNIDLDLGYSTLKESLSLKSDNKKGNTESNQSKPLDEGEGQLNRVHVADADPETLPGLHKDDNSGNRGHQNCDSDIDSGNNSGSESPPPLPGSAPPPLPFSHPLDIGLCQPSSVDQEPSLMPITQWPKENEQGDSRSWFTPGTEVLEEKAQTDSSILFTGQSTEQKEKQDCCDSPGHCDSETPSDSCNTADRCDSKDRCNTADRRDTTDNCDITDKCEATDKGDTAEKCDAIDGTNTTAGCDITNNCDRMSASVSHSCIGEEPLIVAHHETRRRDFPDDFIPVERQPSPPPSPITPRKYIQEPERRESLENGDAVEEETIVAVSKQSVESRVQVIDWLDNDDSNRATPENSRSVTDSDISDEDGSANVSQSFMLEETDTSTMVPEIEEDIQDGVTLVSYEHDNANEESESDPESEKETTQGNRPQDLSLYFTESSCSQPVTETIISASTDAQVESRPPAPEHVSSPTSPSKGEESVERGREFAERVQPKYIIKKQSSGSSGQEFSQEDLEEQLMERQAVLKQTTVRKRNTNWSNWANDHLQMGGDVESESINRDATVYQWEKNIASETSVSPAERKVSAYYSSEDKAGKVNLYSENIISEQDTTEEVDREPIANIASTKKHWENLFQEKSTKQEEVKPKLKGSVRHWDVKIHKYEKRAVDMENNNNNEVATMVANENESAIEREIRLALEREEMLKQEKALLSKVTPHHTNGNQSNGTIVETIQLENNVSVHSSYDEMTEVDRAASLLRNRVMGDLSPLTSPLECEPPMEEDERRPSIGSSRSSTDPDEGRNGVFVNESIVEREIREATEREEERRLEREGYRTTSRGSLTDRPADFSLDTSAEVDTMDGFNGRRERMSPELTYADAVSHYDHGGESLIARELRETREREEELRRLRQKVYSNNSTSTLPTEATVQPEESPKPIQASVHALVQSSAPESRGRTGGSWHKDVSPFVPVTATHKRNSSVDSLSSSHSSTRGTGSVASSDHAPVHERIVKVQPHQSIESTEEASYRPLSETPIEREIRLAKEREDDFRRSKGIPIVEKKPEPSIVVDSPTSSSLVRPVQLSSDSSTLKRLTNNRLQKEINKEKQREETLRKDGRIATTSDERVGQTNKYIEVKDKTDGTPKRNFVINKGRQSTRVETLESAKQQNGSVTPSGPQTSATPETTVTPSITGKTKRLGGGATFSYKETKQKAESKIEQELREMREREDELKQRRANAVVTSPADADASS